jgi:hypothetical protein
MTTLKMPAMVMVLTLMLSSTVVAEAMQGNTAGAAGERVHVVFANHLVGCAAPHTLSLHQKIFMNCVAELLAA